MTHKLFKRFMDIKTWTVHYRKIQQAPTEELRIQAEKEYHEEMMLLLQKDTRPLRERLLDWSHERLELDPTMDLKKLSAKIFHVQWELLIKQEDQEHSAHGTEGKFDTLDPSNRKDNYVTDLKAHICPL